MIQKTAQDTLASVEMDCGEIPEYGTSDGSVWRMKLIRTFARIIRTALKTIKIEENAARTDYIFILLCIVPLIACHAGEHPFASKAEKILSRTVRHGKGELKQVNGIPVLILQGKPEQMGAQYGNILGELIRGLEQHLDEHVYISPQQKCAAQMFVSSLEKNISDRYRKELKAAARASGASYRSLLLLNSIGDVFNMGCSTFAVWGKRSFDGNPLFGRNLDFYTFDLADKLNMILICRPEGRNRFAACAIAGLSAVYSGMNEHGLCLGNMLAHNAKNRLNPTGMFSGFGFRQILEESSTVTEACALIKKQEYCGGNNLMLVDPANKPCIAEIDARTVLYRKPEAEYIYATNHFTFKDLAAHPVSCRRYNTLLRQLEYTSSPLSIEQSKELLTKTAIKSINLQSMIFRPRTREMYCSLKNIPAAEGPFVRIDCRTHFKRAATRTAP